MQPQLPLASVSTAALSKHRRALPGLPAASLQPDAFPESPSSCGFTASDTEESDDEAVLGPGTDFMHMAVDPPATFAAAGDGGRVRNSRTAASCTEHKNEQYSAAMRHRVSIGALVSVLIFSVTG